MSVNIRFLILLGIFFASHAMAAENTPETLEARVLRNEVVARTQYKPVPVEEYDLRLYRPVAYLKGFLSPEKKKTVTCYVVSRVIEIKNEQVVFDQLHERPTPIPCPKSPVR